MFIKFEFMLAEYVNKLDIYYDFDNFVFQEGLRRLKPNFQLSNFGYTKKQDCVEPTLIKEN